MLEEFENGGLSPKTHQIFFACITPKKLKSQQSPVFLDLCLRETLPGKSHYTLDAIVFETLRFQNVFRPHENEKPAFFKFLQFEKRFRKAPFL